jgi:hypothetical protein
LVVRTVPRVGTHGGVASRCYLSFVYFPESTTLGPARIDCRRATWKNPALARVALHRFQRGPQGGGDISAWLGPSRLAFQPIITYTVTDPFVWMPPAPTVAGSLLSLHACVFTRALVRVALFLYPLVCYSSFSPVVCSVIFLIRFGCFVVSILLWLLLCLGWFATSLFWYLCFLCVSPWWLISLFVCLSFCWWSSLLERAPHPL